MTYRLPYSAVVACHGCGWPLRFGSGFWSRERGFTNAINQPVPDRWRVICTQCRARRGLPTDAGRIREQGRQC